MKCTDDNLDILQNLEFSVVEIWRANREMSDYSALRAYESAFQLYRAELRGHQPKAPGLTGLDAAAFAAVKAVCEFRLGRGNNPVSGIQACLPFPWKNSWIASGNWPNPLNATPDRADNKAT